MPEVPAPAACAACGTELAPGRLACPACGRLVHGEELRRLAGEAEAATHAGDDAQAAARWRSALALLPPDSRQHAVVAERVAALAARGHGEAGVPAAHPAWIKRAGPLGLLILLIWKFKSVAAFVVSKGTLLTLFLSLGVYWAAWGWRFALGIVAGLYLHEIGHVVALRRFGVRATAPMFVPGLGAFVRHAPLGDPRREARVSIAGPQWGLGAALIALAGFGATASAYWGGIAQWTARLNLLNLVPLPPLDGAAAWRALSGGQRWLLLLVAGGLLYQTGEGMLWLFLPVAAFRALAAGGAADPDWSFFAQLAFTLMALAALSAIPVPVPL